MHKKLSNQQQTPDICILGVPMDEKNDQKPFHPRRLLNATRYAAPPHALRKGDNDLPSNNKRVSAFTVLR